jgi:fatty-acyl-CoA synthase
MDRKPLATIVLVNKEDTVSDEELTEFLSRDFVKYQIPDYVYINEVPKLALVNLKKEIRRLFAEGKPLKQNSWGLNKSSPLSTIS